MNSLLILIGAKCVLIHFAWLEIHSSKYESIVVQYLFSVVKYRPPALMDKKILKT